MADYRYIQVKVWRDEWFSELPDDGKVFWFYLLTNPSSSVCGMFRLSDKFIAFDTGISVERIRELKEQFKQAGKIEFENDIIWIKKWRELNHSESPLIEKCILKDLEAIPASEIRDMYLTKYSIDTPSIPHLNKQTNKPNRTKPSTAAKSPAAGESNFHKEQQLFIDKFCELTGIPEPDHKDKQFGVLWGGVSARVLKALDGESQTCLEKAVKRMRNDKLTISTPASVEKVIMSIYGEEHSGTPDFSKWTPEQVAAENERMNAHLRKTKT